MRIDIRASSELQGAGLDEWRRLGDLVHPAGRRPAPGVEWAPREDTDQIVRVWDEQELRACAWVTWRRVTIDDNDARVAGVRGVMTHPDQRRRGYGRVAMLHAQAVIDSAAGIELALLFSSVMGVPFYESLGWQPVRVPVYCQQPDGRIDFTEREPDAPVMVRLSSAAATAPTRAIDIGGLPW
jgi:aminoglycoside 2'-N-acetyltransferase I